MCRLILKLICSKLPTLRTGEMARVFATVSINWVLCQKLFECGVLFLSDRVYMYKVSPFQYSSISTVHPTSCKSGESLIASPHRTHKLRSRLCDAMLNFDPMHHQRIRRAYFTYLV